MNTPKNAWCTAVLADASLPYMTSCIVIALAFSADEWGLICESPQSIAHEHSLNLGDVLEHWNDAVASRWLAGYQVCCAEVSAVEVAR